ncbi:MAG TPA: carbohydrate ABC transporter permease, partial [Lacunisphaera sp.]|nr:carbohydrate ABC transporter permease [Lacunisphaera sp.]
MRALPRFLTYLALLAGAALFLLPLLWMLSTALKPIEQTTVQPPEWLPRRYYLAEDGPRREVKLSAMVNAPSVWAMTPGAPAPVVLPETDVRDGVWTTGSGRQVPVEIRARIPASPDAPWREVIEVGTGRRSVVSVERIEGRLAPRWENFANAIDAMQDFWRYFRNTVVLCVVNVVGMVLSSSLVAYGFSRIDWRGRDRLFLVLLGTMMIPFPVVMVPLYALFRELGWIGTLRPLWVTAFFASAFNVFLLRQFFRTIPRELSEAARIDGCGEFRIFWQIILPLCRPALVVVALFTFLATWNDFLGPLIYLTDERDFTLALALMSLQQKSALT